MSNIVVPRALDNQTQDPEIRKEMEAVKDYIDRIEFGTEQNISVVLLQGRYNDFEKKMNTVVAFVNKLPKAIKELHCVLSISSKMKDVQIAKATINFTEDFMGELLSDDILLVHMNIPVKGLTEDRIFSNKELDYAVNDVRVTYLEA